MSNTSEARVAVIGVDCGATTLRAGRFSGSALRPDAVEEAATSRRVDHLAAQIAGLVAGFGSVSALGVAIAGLVDHRSGGLMWMPRRGGDPALRQHVADATGLPVAVDNDANAAALAEATEGAGSGHRMVLMVTVGTGIGGGLVVDGRVERGRGHLGEVGHVLIAPDGPRCACGMVGCWEALASGTALDRAARAVASAHPDGATARLGDDPPTGRHLAEAAAGGDEAAVRAVTEVGEWFGRGLAGLVSILDPDVIVVGGGVSTMGELFLAPARAELARRVAGAGHRAPTPVVTASFGTGAGLVGAALMARAVEERSDGG